MSEIKGVNSVEFDRSRWRVVITLNTEEGTQRYVADAALQSGDGIWFGTQQEHVFAESEAYS